MNSGVVARYLRAMEQIAQRRAVKRICHACSHVVGSDNTTEDVIPTRAPIYAADVNT